MSETSAIEQFPGFSARKIFKGRIVPPKENVGKSKGYRVIFEMVNDNSCVVLVFSRHGVYRSEAELIALMKERLS